MYLGSILDIVDIFCRVHSHIISPSPHSKSRSSIVSFLSQHRYRSVIASLILWSLSLVGSVSCKIGTISPLLSWVLELCVSSSRRLPICVWPEACDTHVWKFLRFSQEGVRPVVYAPFVWFIDSAYPNGAM